MQSFHSVARKRSPDCEPAFSTEKRTYSSDSVLISKVSHTLSQLSTDKKKTSSSPIHNKQVSHSSVFNPAFQSAPVFDLKFVASDQDVSLALQTINKQHQDDDVVVMNSHDGLEQDNLVHRLTIAEDGSHQVHPGKLFKHSSPLVLVLDIRHMRADEITAFNDLLDPDSPGVYSKEAQQKQPLGK
ncbi:hypothetical protein, partial [Sansalvadorimonas verongulae]|uniref:hypothetical protein n=1 Tax=Sansalvadorimonas verongulae TaxID=2172824 RepID=UPI0012BC7E63